MELIVNSNVSLPWNVSFVKVHNATNKVNFCKTSFVNHFQVYYTLFEQLQRDNKIISHFTIPFCEGFPVEVGWAALERKQY